MMRHRQPRRNKSKLPTLRVGDHNSDANSNDAGPREAPSGGGAKPDGPGQNNQTPGETASRGFTDPDRYRDIVAKRILSHIVDSAILLAIMLPLGFFLVIGAIASFGLLALPFAFAFLALRFFYYVGFTAGSRGATPGMRMLGIQLRRINGGQVDFLQSFLRIAIYYVSVAVLTPLVLLVAFFSEQRRALHDHLSETGCGQCIPIGCAILRPKRRCCAFETSEISKTALKQNLMDCFLMQ